MSEFKSNQASDLSKFKQGESVEIFRLDDELTSKELIGMKGVVREIDGLANGQFNYTIECVDGHHYMHEGELRRFL